MTKGTPDLSILVALAADGRISQRDWQVIDAVHVRGLGIRETARAIGVHHSEVQRRLKRITNLAK